MILRIRHLFCFAYKTNVKSITSDFFFKKLLNIQINFKSFIKMAFSLPSVKVKPELSQNVDLQEGSFGVPDIMKYGFASVKSSTEIPHPLVSSEANYAKNRNQMNMAILRNTQGLHAPLKLAMEMNAARKIGRLPFLASSNIMSEVLIGRDIEIGFEDFLNVPEFREIAGQPHAMMERSLGIL